MTGWKSWKTYREDESWVEPLPKGGDLPWALFYPASYEVGSANLGMHHVYRALRRSGVGVERFFPAPSRPTDP
ncbi:hypothetical protein [Aminomonas paucivorans]|uniref:hypothetical protein n=1 Tax=Aminomonas paucivorans TaxID=81412 RepID=UPI003328A202